MKTLWNGLLLALTLAGCSALPASGPTESEIFKAEQSEANTIGYRIVDLDARSISVLKQQRQEGLAQLAALKQPVQPNRIGVGDILSIMVYEIGQGLFDGGRVLVVPGSFSSRNATSTLPELLVDEQGDITFPFAGRIHAAGLAPAQLQEAIQKALAGKSPNPQIVVNISTSLHNSVIVSGDVRQPGRRPLTLDNERVLDMIALAGGPNAREPDNWVEIERQGHFARMMLRDLMPNSPDNITLSPGDRIHLRYQPNSFTVFGASEKVTEIPFDAVRVTLAEGIARAGGLSNERADPNAVFLFRYEPASVVAQLDMTEANEKAKGDKAKGDLLPIIYRLDLQDPKNYFFATQFSLQDKDLIYVAIASTDRLHKFLGMLTEIVSPIMIGRSMAP